MKHIGKKLLVIFTIFSIFFSYSSPLIAYAENGIDESLVDSEKSMNQNNEEVSEESDIAESTDSEESIEQNDQSNIETIQSLDESVLEENVILDQEKVIEETNDSYSAVIKESNFNIYIDLKSSSSDNIKYSSSQYLESAIEVSKKVVTENNEYVLFSIEGKKIGWININAIEKNDAVNSEIENTEKEEVSEVEIKDIAESEMSMSQSNSLRTSSSTLPQIQYRAHVQTKGWLPWVNNQEVTGTIGNALQMEAFQLKTNSTTLGIRFQTLSENGNWTSWQSGEQIGGTVNQKRQLEAFRLELTGEDAAKYDVYYRAHSQTFGWLSWAKNGEKAGTEGYGYRIEAMQVSIVPKGNTTISSSRDAFKINQTPIVNYRAHVQTEGWLPWVTNKETSGTLGKALRMEAFQINTSYPNLEVRHQTRSENGNWSSWQSNSQIGGTTNQKRQLEGVKFELTGLNAAKFDVYYRVHSQSFGWLPWAKNGEQSGTEGYDYRIESMEITVLPKGDTSIDTSGNPYRKLQAPEISYRTHVQTEGWLAWKKDKEVSGTIGKARRVEAFQINTNHENIGIRFQTRSINGNWTSWQSNGQVGGTTNQQRQLEGVKFELTGQDASRFDIYYRVHTQKFGWLPWTKNGEKAGTEGYNYRIEAMQVSVLPKGNTSINTSGSSYRVPAEPILRYQTHVQSVGWQQWVGENSIAGTNGRALQLEAIRVDLNDFPVSGDIEYRTHIQSKGWSSYTSGGNISGTVGNRKRLEAIEVRLTGELSKQYDVYYRSHVQSKGWLGWVRNGMSSGSEELGYRMEAVQIKIVPKGQGEPVNAKDGFVRPTLIYLDPGHGGYESGAVSGGVYEKTINLQTSKKIESILKSKGYSVYMSRDSDERLSLSQRAQEANRMNASIFISVHYNAFRGTSEGIETFYYNQSGNTINPYANNAYRINSSRNLATNIHKNVLRSSGAVDRYVRTANFHVIRETHMPAVLLELGYVDHAGERAKIKTASYQQKLAQGVAEGIDQYFGN